MIVHSAELEQLVRKLSRCQDSKTGSRSFNGRVRILFQGDNCIILPEDIIWETSDSGDHIDIRFIRDEGDHGPTKLLDSNTIGDSTSRPDALWTD